ncbi:MULTISPECIES: hypothetical protein [unclassified Haladaptatus]|uniref:hypothetical protein n=1 Tax=unclassified Haladaptatus TaxID=2622732 RepID=UPI00209BBFE2|nr:MULTISPECIES: hypothetical protein [unclassified Haladaptatus]MCO8245901.1 hypothetical protein [Haladaptatus sp. AB643]MCO8254479.1 hypothetical protein [Haladaptatus sp. AB618]
MKQSRNPAVRRILAGRAVWGWYLLLVVPLVLGAVDARLMTPLALPGYFALTLGSAYGSHLFPTLELWVFWIPFFIGAYLVSVPLAAVYRTVRKSFVAFK